jgi:hypothetical protein
MGKTKKHGGRQSASDLLRLARRAMEKHDFKEALKNAKVCYRQDGAHEHRQILERAWLARGLQLALAGFPAEARAAAQELMSLGALEPEVQRGLPELLMAVGLYDQAVASGKLPGDTGASDPAVSAKAADRAVADPATAPASIAGIREGATAVRAALDALYVGDEAAALATLNDVSRNSPFADWKLFVRGLAAYYRHDVGAMSANWGRLAPERFAARLAGCLRLLSDADADNRGELRAALRVVEKDLLGERILWCLESLQKSLAAGRWREAVFGVRRWKKDFQASMPGLAERIERFFYDMAVRKANLHWLDDLSTAVDPPWWDPRWNRARAVICEDDDESSLEDADKFWTAYLEDLPTIAELKPAERSLAQAMVWDRMGARCVEGAENAEEDYEHEKQRYGDDQDEEYQQQQLKLIDRLKNRALDYFNKAIELAPAHAPPHHHLAEAHAQWGQEESAAAAYARLLAHVPDDFEAIVALYKHHRRRDEGPAARECAVHARRLKPASKDVVDMVVKARLDAARIMSGEGRFDEARGELSALEAEGGTTPAYDLTVARAMIEFKAALDEAGWRLVEQALKENGDPADVYLLLAIEAVRYDLPFRLNDLATHFQKKWEASMKTRRSRAAGPISRRMLAIVVDVEVFEGRHAFLADFLERAVKYVKGATRIRWQVDDLLAVCRFLYRVIEFPKYRPARKPLGKLLDSARKKFAQEPLFHAQRGELEFGRGPNYCDRRLARRCFEMAIASAKTSPRADAKDLAAGAAKRLRYLDAHGDRPPHPPRFQSRGGLADIPPELFDDVPPEQLIEAIMGMGMAMGVDPNDIIEEVMAKIANRTANDDKAASTTAQGRSL